MVAAPLLDSSSGCACTHISRSCSSCCCTTRRASHSRPWGTIVVSCNNTTCSGSPVRAALPPGRYDPPRRRDRVLAGAVGGALGLAALLAGYSVYSRHQAGRPPPPPAASPGGV